MSNIYRSKKAFRATPLLVLTCLLFGATPFLLYATEYSSASFQVKDPVLHPAEYATSSGYAMSLTVGQIAIGTSTVTTAGAIGELHTGFQYFPFVSTPVPTATAGNAQVSLSWTAASGFLGWIVSDYSVGRSTTSGGSYTYTSAGNVTSNTVTGLTNGTTYYFIILVKDGLGNTIASSTEVSATPAGSSVTVTPGGGGGFVIPPIYSPTTPIVIPPLTELPVEACGTAADLNCDGYVDIIDFSIMYYWFDKTDPPDRVDLTRDGVIDLADFSVMAYYWHERS